MWEHENLYSVPLCSVTLRQFYPWVIVGVLAQTKIFAELRPLRPQNQNPATHLPVTFKIQQKFKRDTQSHAQHGKPY